VKKPLRDTREYRILRLANGVTATLIHDSEADKAAAAASVRAGFFCDPPERPGLAHFLEHLLFFSSERFPEEDEYSKFVTEHGGRSNAYTAAEETNYQFDVNWDSLEEALDRFSCFFTCPLLSQDGGPGAERSQLGERQEPAIGLVARHAAGAHNRATRTPVLQVWHGRQGDAGRRHA